MEGRENNLSPKSKQSYSHWLLRQGSPVADAKDGT